MDRNEVLERLDAAGEPRGPIEYEMVRKELLRAAAEIIRASAWRPIAEAPEDKWLMVGKHALGEWYPNTCKRDWAIANGYTHYLPEPAPPAREVEND